MKFFSSGVLVGSVLLTGALLLLSPAAQAHHVMDLMQLKPTPISGMLSGLLHPVIGPDHLLFLLSLSLVGWQRRWPSMLTLLATGLAGSALGLWLPGLPGAEALVAFSLVLVGLVLLRRLPQAVLFPAFALHGYVLSASVLGWTTMPIASYLLGLLISQGLLLLLALVVLQGIATGLAPTTRRWLAALLIGLSAAGGLAAVAG